MARPHPSFRLSADLSAFNTVDFILRKPSDLDAWLRVAQTVAGEAIWPAIDPDLAAPARPLLDEPPLPPLDPDDASFSHEDRARWRGAYDAYLRQESRLYRFNLWLLKSVAPHYWACFRREATARGKMVAIKRRLSSVGDNAYRRPPSPYVRRHVMGSSVAKA